MKAKSPLMLMASFMLALLLAAMVYLYLSGLENKSAKIVEYDIIVAGVEIPQYTKISKEMISKVKVKQLPADSESYYSNAADVAGKYSSERILKGEQFFKSRVLENSQGNLALTLRGTNRAVSVMANLESGVAKLIKTGDDIDILVSLPELKDQDKVIRPEISKIILQKILVLAVDQKTSTSSENGALPTDDKNKTGGGSAESIFYLTLSVPVSDLEKLALAENIGRLKFALRPKGDNTIYPTDGAIWEELLIRSGAKATTAPVKPVEKPAVIAPKTSTPTTATPVASTLPVTKPRATTVSYTDYVVKYGDTLMNIARTQLHDPSKYKLLQKINHIADPSAIRPGTHIKIPVTK